MLSERVKQRITDIMLTTYGHMPSVTPQAVDAMLAEFDHVDAELLEGALHDHMTSTETASKGQLVGDTPPTIARLLLAIRSRQSRLKIESRNKRQQDVQDKRTKTLKVPDHIKMPQFDEQGNLTGYRTHIKVFPTTCKHCGDTGMARFYWQQPDKKRVYLAPEFLELPLHVCKELSIASAICDCIIGQAHHDYGREITYGTGEHARVYLKFAHLSIVRRLAEKRRLEDQQLLDYDPEPELEF